MISRNDRSVSRQANDVAASTLAIPAQNNPTGNHGCASGMINAQTTNEKIAV